MSTDAAQSEAPPPAAARDRWGFFRARTLSRWQARLLSLAGVGLIAVSLTGWWLTTRVLSDDGFGDVVAKTVLQQPVRNYIADQATLRFAKSNKLVTAARPVVTRFWSFLVVRQPDLTKTSAGCTAIDSLYLPSTLATRPGARPRRSHSARRPAAG